MILVTGGCGYLGSHFIVKLIQKGFDVISLDNLSNSSIDTNDKIKEITGETPKFIVGDIRNEELLNKIFFENPIVSVAHFAGLKYLSESLIKPLDYYSVNVSGTINLLNSMNKASIKNIIFSSSATVYGKGHKLPWHENLILDTPSNPYAQTKFIVETILKNQCSAVKKFNVGILRYFNPVGCHPTGKIGENMHSDAGNLLPSIVKVLLKEIDHLQIFGNDYPTLDGTGVRDYIHVQDLVDGHIKALEYVEKKGGYNIWNLGRGEGYSVFEVIKKFEFINKTNIPYKIVGRRADDLPEYWADIKKAKDELNWNAKNNLDQIVIDTLNFVNKLKLKK